jgi:hypothetical protein
VSPANGDEAHHGDEKEKCDKNRQRHWVDVTRHGAAVIHQPGQCGARIIERHPEQADIRHEQEQPDQTEERPIVQYVQSGSRPGNNLVYFGHR